MEFIPKPLFAAGNHELAADENRFAVPRDEEWTGNIPSKPHKVVGWRSLVTTWPKRFLVHLIKLCGGNCAYA